MSCGWRRSSSTSTARSGRGQFALLRGGCLAETLPSREAGPTPWLEVQLEDEEAAEEVVAAGVDPLGGPGQPAR